MKEENRPKYEQVGLNVIYYRRKGNMTQFELAEEAKVNRSTISAIERGCVGMSLDMSFALAGALKIDPADLINLNTQIDIQSIYGKD